MALAEDFADSGRAPVSACPACVVVPAAERIAALKDEIARLEADAARKGASRTAADLFFKK